jgi:pimeloyl-ACP methyl ester carboxylesterase
MTRQIHWIAPLPVLFAGLMLSGCSAERGLSQMNHDQGDRVQETRAPQRTAGQANANGIELAYESVGPTDAEAVLIIAGLGGYMSEEPDPLSEELARRGYRAIRFDNRDIGRSTKLEAAGPPPDYQTIVSAIAAGKPAPVAYTLEDMAKDAVGLLDALHIERAHIVGGSMGGMIAQLVAAEYPERTLSLTSIMSTSGNPELKLGPAVALLGASVGFQGTEEEMLDRKVQLFKTLQGPAYPTEESVLRERIRRDMRRVGYPVGVARQSAATVPNSDRREKLHQITTPTMIVHGEADPIFGVEHAKDQAANIPGAQLRIIPGMGHDLPPAVVPTVVDAIVALASQAHPAKTQ